MHDSLMVKEWTLLNGAHWFKSKKNLGFEQYSSIGINKTGTICCVPFFSLQTFDTLRYHGNRACKKTLIPCNACNYLM